jgi:hypothetical protein
MSSPQLTTAACEYPGNIDEPPAPGADRRSLEKLRRCDIALCTRGRRVWSKEQLGWGGNEGKKICQKSIPGLQATRLAAHSRVFRLRRAHAFRGLIGVSFRLYGIVPRTQTGGLFLQREGKTTDNVTTVTVLQLSADCAILTLRHGLYVYLVAVHVGEHQHFEARVDLGDLVQPLFTRAAWL